MEPHPNATIETVDLGGGADGDRSAPDRIRTDRLALRGVRSDAIAFDRLHDLFCDVADPDEVFDLCGWDRHGTKAETRSYLERKRTMWERGESYEYVIETVDDHVPEPAGDENVPGTADNETVSETAGGGEYVGTTCVEVADDGSCEFGLWLDRPHWGRGFSREATDALVHVSFECLDAPFVVLGCLDANDRSRRAIESFVRRYSGAYYGSLPRASSGRDDPSVHHEWVVTRDGYASGDRGLSTLVPGVGYDDLEF